MKNFIPVNSPVIEKSDISLVKKNLKDGWISSEGPSVKKFEEKLSKYIGHKYGVAVSNGTAALEIAVKSLNIKEGSEVIIPNFTIFSNAIACIKNNLKIVPVDCEIFDWNINYEKIKKAITGKTKLIIATHIYNFPCKINLIKNLCKKKKIFLIEDAAEVLGQKYNNKYCGSFGDIGTFSFYANKQITTGEGGMLTTNSFKIYKKAKKLRNLSFGKIDRFNHDDISWNYRMSNIQASLGLSQLKRLKQIVKKRNFIGSIYYKLLSKNMNLYMPPPKNKCSNNIYWVVAVLIKNTKLNIDAKKAMKLLKSYKIGTRPFFWPMHMQKTLKKLEFYKSKNFKNSEYLSKYGFYLPTSLNLSLKKIKYICNKVNKIIN